jgi:hypothetical protein
MYNYKEKYLKYKNKYIELKKTQTGGNYNYIICLLWFNKELGPIKQLSKDNIDLKIIEKIIKTYNMYKIKYSNPNVILFMNYDKIIPEDFIFLQKNNIETYDINNFETIKSNEKLFILFNSKKYKICPCPVYIYVDMLKILIQYEYMVHKEYEYVVFSDLDIEDKDSLESYKICSNLRPDYIDEYYFQKIFNQTTVALLDVFSYLMTSFADLVSTKKKDEIYIKMELEEYGFTPKYYKIGNKYFLISISLPENGFLICKKNYNVIKAIKDYFIDYIFCDEIYSMTINSIKLYNNHIYNSYVNFYIYLNFLNGLNTLSIILTDKELLQVKEKYNHINNNNVKDFIIDDNKITVISKEFMDFILEKFKKSNHKHILERLEFDYSNLTTNADNIYKKYYYNIFGANHYNDDNFHYPNIPSICVAIGEQKNSI